MHAMILRTSVALAVLLTFFPAACAAEPGKERVIEAPARGTHATWPMPPEVKKRCLKVLHKALQSDEFWPAMHAAEALSQTGRKTEVRKALAPRLEKEQDDQRRCGLARELVRAGDREEVQVLLAILAGPDPYGHVHAAESLYKVGALGDGRALQAAFSQTENVPLRLMAAAALGKRESPQAMGYLRSVLAAEDPQQARIAAWILGRIGGQRDIRLLRKSAQRAADPLDKAYHYHALAALGDPAGLEVLEKNLSADDPAVRTYAAAFAAETRAVNLVPKLIGLLDDAHSDVRIRAAQALFALSQPSKR